MLKVVNIHKNYRNTLKRKFKAFLHNEQASSFVVIVMIFLVIGFMTLMWGILDIAMDNVKTNVTSTSLNLTLNSSLAVYHDPTVTSSYTNTIWSYVLLIVLIGSGIFALYNASVER